MDNEVPVKIHKRMLTQKNKEMKKVYLEVELSLFPMGQ